ncbi:MAG: lipoate--protein ligase family protein [Candidatus Omnitrophica bacterium]|nr:lipoate--protein ligase family protein [Candidatus Omnitrophota bacterium]
MKVRLILDKNYEPYWNMAFDFYFWKKNTDWKFFPVLRFYKWNPSSVSFGYNQRIERLINVEFCNKNNIPMVMRPTGGSAIFHDIEITYSFSSNIKHNKFFLSPYISYIKIAESIIKGLEKLGLKLKIRGVSDNKEPSFTDIPCFSLFSRHDIVFENKKIVGSAQRRNSFSFLQHGSILIDIRKDLWENIFFKKVNFNGIGCLKELVGNFDEEELIKFLKNGFEEVLECEIFEDKLEIKEKKEIENIKGKLQKEGRYE